MHTLPLHLIRAIAAISEWQDIPAMLLTNRHMNMVATPVLYSTIDLDSWDNIRKCLSTLDLSSGECSFNRDLIRLVQRFILQTPRSDEDPMENIGHEVWKLVPRMVHLRHFSSKIGLQPFSSDILYSLVTRSSSLLQSLKIDMNDEVPTALELAAITTPFRTLKLEVPKLSAPAQKLFIRRLLTATAPSLRSLSLASNHRAESSFWDLTLPLSEPFTVLETLTVDRSAIAHSCLVTASNVKSLQVADLSVKPHEVPYCAFPMLEELSCPCNMVPIFLPDFTTQRRPIHTVRICDFPYERPSPNPSPAVDPPEWQEILHALSFLQFSSVYVKKLSFEVSGIPQNRLAAAQPHLVTLEHLEFRMHSRLYTEWLYQLAADVLAHMPKLETLIFSRPFPRTLDLQQQRVRNTRAQRLMNLVLPDLANSCSTLTRVAFSDVEKKKTDSGWVWVGDVGRVEAPALEEPDHPELEPAGEHEGADDTEDEVDAFFAHAVDNADVAFEDAVDDVDAFFEDAVDASEVKETRFPPLLYDAMLAGLARARVVDEDAVSENTAVDVDAALTDKEADYLLYD